MKKIYIIIILLLFIKLNYSDDWKSYHSSEFSIDYPPNFKVDTSYTYQQLGEGNEIKGVSFSAQDSSEKGTNLLGVYITVEWLPLTGCNSKNFLYFSSYDSTSEENGVHYTISQVVTLASGFFFEETVYSRISDTYCYGIRLFVHSSNFNNFDPGTILRYNKNEMELIYRKMRDSIRIVKQ